MINYQNLTSQEKEMVDKYKLDKMLLCNFHNGIEAFNEDFEIKYQKEMGSW